MKNECVRFYDLRRKQQNPKPRFRGKKLIATADGRNIKRNPADIDMVVVHQTAVEFGPRRVHLRQFKGNRELAIAHRALDVACHVLTFEDYFCLANELTTYVNHANRFNARSLGLEIEGLYPGIHAQPTWRKMTTLTNNRVRTARLGLREMVNRGRKQGMPLKLITAHRQSNVNRRSDPGEEIWQRVVLDYGVPKLGLVTAPALTVGRGRPIPSVWQAQDLSIAY